MDFGTEPMGRLMNYGSNYFLHYVKCEDKKREVRVTE